MVNSFYRIETHNAVLDTSTDIFKYKDENAGIAVAAVRLSDAEYEDIKLFICRSMDLNAILSTSDHSRQHGYVIGIL